MLCSHYTTGTTVTSITTRLKHVVQSLHDWNNRYVDHYTTKTYCRVDLYTTKTYFGVTTRPKRTLHSTATRLEISEVIKRPKHASLHDKKKNILQSIITGLKQTLKSMARPKNKTCLKHRIKSPYSWRISWSHFTTETLFLNRVFACSIWKQQQKNQLLFACLLSTS